VSVGDAALRGDPSARARTTAERFSAALPLLTVFAWLCVVYAWQAWSVGTPWVFTDELELTQLARSLAEHGEPARRGEVYWFGSLASFVTAPAWLLNSTESAYQAAKYIGVVAMTAAIFPAYGLARLLVSPRAALFAAAATVAIPAFMYSALLIEEPFAYLASTTCLYLIVRALATRRRRAILAAVVAVLMAPLVRTQLAVLPAIFALSALVLLWLGEPARRLRARWTAWDWAGAITLAVGAVVVVNELLSHASTSWLVATRAYKDRMLEYGVWAGGAFAIGVGILPVIAGFAALVRPRDEERTPARTAFLVVFATSVAAFGFYAAVKAAYVSTVFASRVPERNLIYLAPLFFVATALWLDRPRLRLWPLAAAAVVTLVLVRTTELHLEYPYFEAPGFSILAQANRALELPAGSIRALLVLVVALSVALLVAPRLLERRPRLASAVVAIAAALVLAWNVTGEVTASAGSRDTAERFLANYPDPPDWVDRATGRAPTMYLGQNITDANGIWLTEFWNRSIKYVWSLDGKAPGPGPTVTPNVLPPDGVLQQQRGDVKYVVADNGIEVVGRVIARPRQTDGQPGNTRLYEIDYPVRLRNSIEGQYSDGWIGERATYSQYWTPRRKAGYAIVTASRADWDLPAEVVVRIGTLKLRPDFTTEIGRVTGEQRWTTEPRVVHRFVLPTPPPPFRVEVEVTPTFVPADVDARSSDRRPLGAVVGFGFSPRRPAP
jgi:hypothetical protein